MRFFLLFFFSTKKIEYLFFGLKCSTSSLQLNSGVYTEAAFSKFLVVYIIHDH